MITTTIEVNLELIDYENIADINGWTENIPTNDKKGNPTLMVANPVSKLEYAQAFLRGIVKAGIAQTYATHKSRVLNEELKTYVEQIDVDIDASVTQIKAESISK